MNIIPHICLDGKNKNHQAEGQASSPSLHAHYGGTAPGPPHLLDLFNVRPHLARRETPSHLSSPDGLIPARCLRRADTCQSSMPPHTCTHTCIHTYMCAHSCLHLRALCVPGLSLNIPHLACPACPSNPSSRVRPFLVMPALGCSLSAPQRPPAPGACLDLHICFFAKALRVSSFMYLHAHTIQGPCWEHSDIAARSHPPT